MGSVNGSSLMIKSRATVSYALAGGTIGCNSPYSKYQLAFALLYISHSRIIYWTTFLRSGKL